MNTQQDQIGALQVRCESNMGYERQLVIDRSYQLLEVEPGIFAGDYYATVADGKGNSISAYAWRFGLTNQRCQELMRGDKMFTIYFLFDDSMQVYFQGTDATLVQAVYDDVTDCASEGLYVMEWEL